MLSLLLPLTIYNWMRIYFYIHTHTYCYLGEIIDGHLLAPHTQHPLTTAGNKNKSQECCFIDYSPKFTHTHTHTRTHACSHKYDTRVRARTHTHIEPYMALRTVSHSLKHTQRRAFAQKYGFSFDCMKDF